jgi:hypothetical protein
MSASLLRRLALALMAHAARILPPARSAWAAAMAHELQHIDGDLEALTWAAGCVLASYVERGKAMDAFRTWRARAILAIPIFWLVISFLFATALALAVRLGSPGAAEFLGGFTPGHDYRRFIPLIEATPWWIHGLWVSASMLFFASAWELLRNRAAAFGLFSAAWIVGTTGNLISQSMPAHRAVFSFPTPSFARDFLLPAVAVIVPALIAAALWAHARLAKRALP